MYAHFQVHRRIEDRTPEHLEVTPRSAQRPTFLMLVDTRVRFACERQRRQSWVPDVVRPSFPRPVAEGRVPDDFFPCGI